MNLFSEFLFNCRYLSLTRRRRALSDYYIQFTLILLNLSKNLRLVYSIITQNNLSKNMQIAKFGGKNAGITPKSKDGNTMSRPFTLIPCILPLVSKEKQSQDCSNFLYINWRHAVVTGMITEVKSAYIQVQPQWYLKLIIGPAKISGNYSPIYI